MGREGKGRERGEGEEEMAEGEVEGEGREGEGEVTYCCGYNDVTYFQALLVNVANIWLVYTREGVKNIQKMHKGEEKRVKKG